MLKIVLLRPSAGLLHRQWVLKIDGDALKRFQTLRNLYVTAPWQSLRVNPQQQATFRAGLQTLKARRKTGREPARLSPQGESRSGQFGDGPALFPNLTHGGLLRGLIRPDSTTRQRPGSVLSVRQQQAALVHQPDRRPPASLQAR